MAVEDVGPFRPQQAAQLQGAADQGTSGGKTERQDPAATFLDLSAQAGFGVRCITQRGRVAQGDDEAVMAGRGLFCAQVGDERFGAP
jgi:hypothetical protein